MIYLICIIGFVLGYIVGVQNRDDYPKELEHTKTDLERAKEDLQYYKRLTKGLVEDNAKLREEKNAS